MLSRDGEAGFSVRKLGVEIGVDPMTVLHHFGSKDELLRRIADRALATVELPQPSEDWRGDLRNVAAAYRDLAHRHPRLFHLHFRFHATGPADHASSEVVYRALRSAGLIDAEAAGLGLAFYAFILGYALAEAEGLLRPISDDDEEELRALDPLDCPATLALIPAFKALDRDAAFDASVDAFIDGVSCRCKTSAMPSGCAFAAAGLGWNSELSSRGDVAFQRRVEDLAAAFLGQRNGVAAGGRVDQ